MKKFTTLTTNDDVKKAVKKAAHMLDLAAAEKEVLAAHEASMQDVKKSYRAALDAYMQAKKSGQGWEEAKEDVKNIEESSNALDKEARYSKYLIEGYKHVARLHYSIAAVELVNLNAQYLNGANAGYKQVKRVTMAIEEELGGTPVEANGRTYIESPANVSIYNGSFGDFVALYVSLRHESYDSGYRFNLYDNSSRDTVTISIDNIEQNEHVATVSDVKAAAKKMLTLKQKLHAERDTYQARIKKLYEPCSMFADARDAYYRAYNAQY